MTAPANPTFQIPRDVIEPIIKAHVSSAIVTALGGGTQLVEDAVMRILNQKVDSEGRDTNSDYHSMTWIVFAMRKALREAIIATVAEELPKHKDAMRKLIERELRKTNSPMLKQLVDGMVDSAVDPTNLRYRFEVSYETAEQRRNR